MWLSRSPWHFGSMARSMHILSLSFDCSFITSPILDQVTSNIQLWSLEKRTSGWRDITSSINLNKNISVIYCRIAIKLVLLKAEWSCLLFRKKSFLCHSGLADMTSLNFQLRISLLFFVWWSHNLVRVTWVVHVSLKSYKISYGLQGHLDLWGQLQGKCIFFL